MNIFPNKIQQQPAMLLYNPMPCTLKLAGGLGHDLAVPQYCSVTQHRKDPHEPLIQSTLIDPCLDVPRALYICPVAYDR